MIELLAMLWLALCYNTENMQHEIIYKHTPAQVVVSKETIELVKSLSLTVYEKELYEHGKYLCVK